MREVKCRATSVNDTSIASMSALSRLRLDPILDHILDITKGGTMCSVHRWVGIELERNTYYCPGYYMSLCILYNRVFHQVPDLLGLKGALTKECIQIHNNNKKQKQPTNLYSD